MRIAELRRSVPLFRVRIPRHGEIALVPAIHVVREDHHDFHRGDDGQQQQDVEVDEAQPADAGAATVVVEKERAMGYEAVGWGRGWRSRVVVGDRGVVLSFVGGERRVGWSVVAIGGGSALGARAGACVRHVPGRDAVEQVERRHCVG